METMRFDQWRKEIEKFLSGDFKVPLEKRMVRVMFFWRFFVVLFWFMLVHVFPPINGSRGIFCRPEKNMLPCRPGCTAVIAMSDPPCSLDFLS